MYVYLLNRKTCERIYVKFPTIDHPQPSTSQSSRNERKKKETILHLTLVHQNSSLCITRYLSSLKTQKYSSIDPNHPGHPNYLEKRRNHPPLNISDKNRVAQVPSNAIQRLFVIRNSSAFR